MLGISQFEILLFILALAKRTVQMRFLFSQLPEMVKMVNDILKFPFNFFF